LFEDLNRGDFAEDDGEQRCGDDRGSPPAVRDVASAL
jgi:hypothetical protein